MSVLARCPWSRLRNSVGVALAVFLCACGSGDGDSAPARLVVLSAFPAELAPLLEQATVESTTEIEGRVFRVGRLGGVPVILGLTGIGLVNAAATTRAVLERFAVAGVVVSGVAGSFLRIGDVAVPDEWAFTDGPSYAAHGGWLDLAEEIAASGSVSLENCTLLPSDPSERVCLPHEPAIVVGGIGESDDPFGGMAARCEPGGGDVSGCDVVSGESTSQRAGDRRPVRTVATAEPDAPAAEDMETAAIAREATASGVPFIAFRAVSDGAGDPLGLPGFPAQFFVYYRLAARNAAAATTAFLERVGRVTPTRVDRGDGVFH